MLKLSAKKSILFRDVQRCFGNVYFTFSQRPVTKIKSPPGQSKRVLHKPATQGGHRGECPAILSEKEVAKKYGWDERSLMSLTPHDLARKPKSDCYQEIQELRQRFGDDLVSALLGIHKFALGFKEQPSPAVRRLAFVLHSLLCKSGRMTSIFDILTLGKYVRTPQEAVRLPLDWEI